jgi:magnesium-transporting ATPase (P-type)
MASASSKTVAAVHRTNDGGIVLVLFLMAISIAFAAFASVRTCANHHETTKTTLQKSSRIVSAWSNLGNSAVHWLVVAYITAKSGSGENVLYWEREEELGVGGIDGPLFFAVVNLAVGMCSLHNKFLSVSLVWNSLIAIAGIALPFVWLRFVEEGLATWPYIVVFLWWIIFAMEVSAFAASWTHHLMGASDSEKKEN